MRTKAFHPGTMGVMRWCEIIDFRPDAFSFENPKEGESVTVKFDDPYPGTNKRIFTIPASHLQEKIDG